MADGGAFTTMTGSRIVGGRGFEEDLRAHLVGRRGWMVEGTRLESRFGPRGAQHASTAGNIYAACMLWWKGGGRCAAWAWVALMGHMHVSAGSESACGQNELCDAIAHRFARNSEASAPSVYWSALAAFMAALLNMADTE